MRVLFIHQNYPGQFKYLAPALAADPCNQVVAIRIGKNISSIHHGVQIISYEPTRSTTSGIHPWVSDFETKAIRGEAVFRAALKLKKQGFSPDIIIAHPGWGESLFIKDVWPDARLGMYCEFYYRPTGADVGFDHEFPASDPGDVCRLRLKNTNNLMHFETADAGISPTFWQASTFPDSFRSRISVIHDGINCGMVAPNESAYLTLNSSLKLNRGDEVITFVNRNLEPYRGYHIFMRALPEILRRRPHARVLIVGGDSVSYGARPPAGQTWKEIFFNEVRDSIGRDNLRRLHFIGNIPYEFFIPLLQISAVHVYLTYPFVLSWSLLEAMSAGCPIVASDTRPLHEVIINNETGRLVNFFDYRAIADEVCDLLENEGERTRLGRNARAFAVANYDLQTICLPRQIEWVKGLAEK